MNYGDYFMVMKNRANCEELGYRTKRRVRLNTVRYEEQDGYRNRSLTFELYGQSFELGGSIEDIDMESMVTDLISWAAKRKI